VAEEQIEDGSVRGEEEPTVDKEGTMVGQGGTEEESVEGEVAAMLSDPVQNEQRNTPWPNDGAQKEVTKTETEEASRPQLTKIRFQQVKDEFLHMMKGTGTIKVDRIEYVVNPPLINVFDSMRAFLGEMCEEEQKPLLAFHHGTWQSIDSIVQHNFDLSLVKPDNVWYGAGIYFSQVPSAAMRQAHGAQTALLSKVLQGNVYRCTKRMFGAGLTDGFHSHRSPDGRDFIIFDVSQILPSYIVHYTKS